VTGNSSGSKEGFMGNVRGWACGVAAVLASSLLAACGGSDDSSLPPAVGPSAQTVGPAGATITGESGLAVAIPAGALTESVTIRMARDATGAPAIDAGSRLAGPIHALTPHGITFARPAVVRIPFDPSTSPEAGAVPVLFKASPGGQWMALADTARDGDTLLADVTSFSYFVVQWCRPRYAAGVTLAVCSYAQRDVSIEFVSPLPPVPPVRRSDPRAALGLRAIDPALQLTRPSLLVIRVAIEALYATDTPDHLVEFEIIDYHGHAVAGGAFPSADLRGGRKIIDVAVAVLDSDNGLRPYRVEVFCRATDSAGSCSGGLIADFVRTPEIRPYRVAGNTLLVNVAIPAGTPPDPAALPMVDASRSGFVRQAADGGGVVANWTLPILSTSQFLDVQATTAQPADHRWQMSLDNGVSWSDWGFEPAYWTANRVPVVVRNVGQSARHVCVGFAALPCPRLDVLTPVFPQFDRADINGLKFRIVASNAFGSTTGPVWTVAAAQVGTPPVISTQPVSMRVVSGGTASFSAVAIGVPAPALQWQRRAPTSTDWLDIPGATSGTYTTPALALIDSSTLFRVRATNVEGAAISDPAAAVVDSGAIAPLISTQPQSLVILKGSEAVFAVVADGTSPLSFQWRKNGVDITGANAPTLKLPATALADAGSYSVAVTNPVGSATSNAATLTVNESGPPALVAPTIVTAPASATVNAGNSASFAVAVTGSGPLAYQWHKNGTAIGGAAGAVYTIGAVAAADAGAYTVVITNAAGSATSPAASLTVNPGPAPVAPAITTPPTGLVVIPGATATFAVAATGSGPLAFQWQRNGADLPGATAPVLTFTNVSGAEAGNYSVVVSNAAGSVASAIAPLMLLGAPAISSQPGTATVAQGLSASFAVAATGEALRYQWLKNGVAVPGATSAAYMTPPTQASDNGAVFSVIVYNNAGLVISGGALLTVVAPATPPVITVEPVNATVNDGEFATIVTEVGGSRPLTFQLQRLVGSTWTDAGTAVSTSSLLPVAVQTPTLTAADSGAQLRVVFSNAVGNVATRAVTVTVNPAAPASALKGIAIAAGYRNSFVVAPDRTVWAWGEAVDATTGHYNVSGSWTQWALRPVQVAGLADVIKVATSPSEGTASRAHYALHADGTVSAWGNNNYGQLGDRTVAVDRIAPVKVLDGAMPLDKVCDIAAGNAILVAIRSDEADGSCGPGKARRAWIAGIFVGSVVGGLAVPSATHPYNGAIVRPVPGLPAGVPVARIRVPDAAFANAAVLFFLEDGRVFAWGWNYDNALGGGGALSIGIASAAGTSAEVTGFWGNAEWAEIGRSFTISRQTDGTLRSLGRNAFGQLGDGVSSSASRTTLQNVATPVTLATEPQALSVGHETVLAIERANGALWGWGDGYGLISSTPNEAVVAPRRIGTGTGFQAVSAGNRHALAIGPGNVIYAWGFRESGGLGDGEITGLTITPTMVTR
jgi:alpha-tubulin suppressor-like RCC1 family protein